MARELSIFVDESGGRKGTSRYYLLSLVFHEQAKPIAQIIHNYELLLQQSSLPDIPFHSEPLLNGHKSYRNLEMPIRRALMVRFANFVHHLPIKYASFAYKRSELSSLEEFTDKMRGDIAALIADNLDFFQAFDVVKVYYDDGQDIVRHALERSIGLQLSQNVVVYRETTMREFRLAQVADYLCTLELAALKYEHAENGSTYNKFFGSRRDFKKNWLKQARCKRIN